MHDHAHLEVGAVGVEAMKKEEHSLLSRCDLCWIVQTIQNPAQPGGGARGRGQGRSQGRSQGEGPEGGARGGAMGGARRRVSSISQITHIMKTVEPPNSGRVGTIDVVPYSEVEP